MSWRVPAGRASADPWNELVTVGLLGTDRRDPPDLPDGPVADLVADSLRPTPQGRLLVAVSAMVVAQRCGARPMVPCASLMPPAADPRPMLPVAAAGRWYSVVAHWPVLEPEWLAAATAHGWRPSPDVLVAMLRRHRRSAAAGSVIAFGGPVASWLIEHDPGLEPLRSSSQTAEPRLPAVPAELEALLEADASSFAHAVVGGLRSGCYKWSHRAVLLNALSRVRRASLGQIIAALELAREAGQHGGHPPSGAPLSLWESLLELAVVRRDMLVELEPPR